MDLDAIVVSGRNCRAFRDVSEDYRVLNLEFSGVSGGVLGILEHFWEFEGFSEELPCVSEWLMNFGWFVRVF